MAEGIKFELTVDDKGSATIKRFDGNVD